MVKNRKQHSEKTCARQGVEAGAREPHRIESSTPYDFKARNLTPYGGLLPVATMLEKLEFQQVVQESIPVERQTRCMNPYQFLLAQVLAIYVGFPRLAHFRFLKQEPMLLGILKVAALPVQTTFWRFMAHLPGTVAGHLLKVQKVMRQRVWDAAHVGLRKLTMDSDTTVQNLFGDQMGGRKSYNPKNKGKNSYQPILSFLAETKEYIAGELHNGDRPSGEQIARHLESVIGSLPQQAETIYARADAGFYCWEAVETYQKHGVHFILSASKTAPVKQRLEAAEWKPARRADCDGETEFMYQPHGWKRACRFIALRYRKKKPAVQPKGAPEQYELFETPEYTYRVFVTDMRQSVSWLGGFYDQRATAENLIKEANNDAGLTAHPSGRWPMNCIHFQLTMLAYNLNCWLQLFSRDEQARLKALQHTTLAISRLRFLFVAAKIWRHAGRVGVSYSDHYEEKDLWHCLMRRLRAIRQQNHAFAPVIAVPLRT
jgi:DDE family transposase